MEFLKKPVLSLRSLVVLLLILALHLFMRLYHANQNLGFGHDEDLSAWIAKDIIIDHNLRLIGQETSIGSLFIGPIFYYLQALYFAIFNMDPIAGLYMTLTISVVMLFSVYYVFKRFFGETVGLIGSLIYAGSQALANHDTWIVPTQPTLLWTTWYLYVLFYITKETNPKIFIPLGILLGLIWHIHIAFVPLLLLLPLALYLNRKAWFSRKNFLNKYSLIGILLFLSLMLPFFTFEIRHNFMQLIGLVNSLSEDRNASEGRLFKIYDGASWSFMNILYEVKYTNESQIRILQAVLLALLIGTLILTHKSLGKKAWLIYGWIILMILAQILSKRAISEYYFTNLTILSILTLALTLSTLSKYKFTKPIVVILLGLFVLLNTKNVIAQPQNGEGYLMRKRLINYIAEDAKKNNYPCIAINYMTSPGKSAGFRYFFWWNNLNLVTPANDIPVYSLLNPAAMAEDEITYRAGVLAVIPPKNPKTDEKVCNDPNRQLPPLWGFNN